MAATRTERDSLGPIEVPAEALWGAQTERSRRHFVIGEQRMPLALIHAMARIKQAQAEVHGARGRLDAPRAQAIAAAAARVAAGEVDAAFVLSVWQTGSGTHSHMNVNEVVARLANQALGDDPACHVHANDHVNLGQSSNDVFPSALHLAALAALAPLRTAMAALAAALQAKALAWRGIVKVGRTHLQDAAPVTLGQAFAGYAARLALAQAAIEAAVPGLRVLALGGTAVGTGLGTTPEIAAAVVARLADWCGEPLSVASDHHAAQAGREAVVALHAALRALAIVLIPLGNDLRLMGSGPRAGLGELRLPAGEPGSSMMPGKVNPTQVEALQMVCLQVLGHDVALGFAASQGQFELNALQPLIALNLLDSLRLLADAVASFTTHCVEGLAVDTERIARDLAHALVTATALVPHLGHERAAQVVGHAQAHGLSLREAALALGVASAAEFDHWVDARRMAGL